jgi:molybdenum cofactor cytidylyltransferase
MVRSFAIVPAAGRSVRMGQPKLLLPAGYSTIIERVLSAWTASRVTRTVVVVRRDDEELKARCRGFNVDIVTPASPPEDMKASIACALDHVARRYAPVDDDAWLVAPADMPRLSARTIDLVLNSFDPAQPRPIVPLFRGQRGHPLLLPWRMAEQLHDLAPDEGVNALMAGAPSREIECGHPGILFDLDTPGDFESFARADSSPCTSETDHQAAVF